MPWKFYDKFGVQQRILYPFENVTTLPTSVIDGQIVSLVDSLTTPTYHWLLRYNSVATGNKWEFVGGSPLEADVAISQSTASTTYVALATAGPVVTLPRAGDYLVRIGCAISNAGVAGSGGYMSYDVGATAAVDGDAVMFTNSGTQSVQVSVARLSRETGLTAVTLTAKYKAANANAATFANRWMSVTPISLS